MAILKTTEKKIKSGKALYHVFMYISEKEKCSAINFSDGCSFISASETANSFQQIQRIYRKENGILAHHFIHSYDPKDNITPEQAQKISVEFARRAFPNYETVVATHADCNHIHSHIIVNSVNTESGYKFHDNKDTLFYLRNLSNHICKCNKLNTMPLVCKKGIDQATVHTANSWKKELLNVLDEAILYCNSKEEFITLLYLRGFSVKYTAKNITITKDGFQKGIRVDTLAKQFNNDKYTKRKLEKLMGFFEPLTSEQAIEKQRIIAEKKRKSRNATLKI
jgi:hypothetical protein